MKTGHRVNAASPPELPLLCERLRLELARTRAAARALREGRRLRAEARAQPRWSVDRLALQVTSSSPLAWALVENGKVTASNSRFLDLSRGRVRRRWQAGEQFVPADEQLSLRELVVREARHLLDAGEHHRRQRYVNASACVIEVIAERHWPQPSANGDVVAIGIHEVTEMVLAEERLRLLEAQVLHQSQLCAAGARAAAMVHDLGNVLTAVALRLDLLSRDPALIGKQERNLKATRRIVAEGIGLVRRLQDGARGSSLGLVHLGRLVEEAIEISEAGLRPESAPIRIEIGSSVTTLAPVKAPADELRHVVSNLLVNARHAMREGGTIEIDGGTRPDGSIVLRIRDHGQGIPGDILERIFDPFFSTKGTAGIGLYSARRLMDDLGGSIRALSGPDRGAIFELRFPVAANTANKQSL